MVPHQSIKTKNCWRVGCHVWLEFDMCAEQGKWGSLNLLGVFPESQTRKITFMENNFYGILRISSFPLQYFIWNFPRKFVAVISECLRSTEWKLEAHAMRFLQVLLAWNGLILMLIISPNTIDAVFRTRVWPIWRKCYLISIRTCLTTIHWLLVSKNNSHEANEWLL